MKKIDFDIIPLAIALMLIIISIILVFDSNSNPNLKHYLGLTSSLISILLYIRNRMAYYIVFAFSLLLGVFGLLDFYYISYKVGFGSFGVNPIYTILLIVHFAIAFQIAEKTESR